MSKDQLSRISYGSLVDAAFSGFKDFAITSAERALDSRWRNQRDTARRVLSKIAAYDGDYESAIGYYSAIELLDRGEQSRVDAVIYHSHILRMSGRISEARDLLKACLSGGVTDPALFSAVAGIPVDDEERLTHLNLALEGFAEIEKKVRNDPLSVHNITSCANDVECGPVVSIIMPAYNAQSTLEMAAESVLRQSWRRCELIIVDDCSQDATWEVARKISACDSRVKAMRMTQNSGAYACRNAGLRMASGQLVTVNDSDDWSHPQRIEVQVEDILGGARFNTTFGLRVTENLELAPRARSGAIQVENTSSLLMFREDVIHLGGWDEVRFSADSELYERLLLLHEQPARPLHPRVPLSFILSRVDSLTNTAGSTGLDSIVIGARRTYKDISRHWHARGGRTIKSGVRAFPVPQISLPKRMPVVELDTLLIGDFATRPVEVLPHLGQIGYFHLPHPSNIRSALSTELLDDVLEGRVRPVVAGEFVKCRLVVLDGPIEYLSARMPQVEASDCFVVNVSSQEVPFMRDRAREIAPSASLRVYEKFKGRMEIADAKERVKRLAAELKRLEVNARP